MANLAGAKPSRLSEHGHECCSNAKEWFFAMDCSLGTYRSSTPPPTWIRRRFDWGPTRWPLYWCRAVESPTLDCGALADLTRNALLHRGLSALSCQIVEKFNRDNVSHWRRAWEKAGVPANWTSDIYAYHEICAILEGNSVSLWDPTDNKWVVNMDEGYGSLQALRITPDENLRTPEALRCNGQEVLVGNWTIVRRIPAV